MPPRETNVLAEALVVSGMLPALRVRSCAYLSDDSRRECAVAEPLGRGGVTVHPRQFLCCVYALMSFGIGCFV